MCGTPENKCLCITLQSKHYIFCIIPSLVWKTQVINEMLLNTWFFYILFKMNCQWAKMPFSYLVGFMVFWYYGSVFFLFLEAENIFHLFWYLSLYFHFKKDKLKSLIPLFCLAYFHSTISNFSASHYLPVELIFLLFLRSSTTLLASLKHFSILLLLSVTFPSCLNSTIFFLFCS